MDLKRAIAIIRYLESKYPNMGITFEYDNSGKKNVNLILRGKIDVITLSHEFLSKSTNDQIYKLVRSMR